MTPNDASPVFALADRYIDAVGRARSDPGHLPGRSGLRRPVDATSRRPASRSGPRSTARPRRAGVARPPRADDELAAAFLAERLGTALALVDADEPLRAINNLGQPGAGASATCST